MPEKSGLYKYPTKYWFHEFSLDPACHLREATLHVCKWSNVTPGESEVRQAHRKQGRAVTKAQKSVL